MPELWLDRFTADADARAYGGLYIAIVAPFYGVFGAGQALYFASQGPGRMLLPVTVSVVRLFTVVGLGAMALALSWDVGAVFAGVSVGLTIVGVGQGLCLLGRAWRPRTHP